MTTWTESTRYGLIGHPLGHSLSPALHDWLARQAGLEGDYALMDLPPDRLAGAVMVFRHTLRGFNCTIPYKQTILPLLDDLSPEARRYGAVNTVAIRQGRLVGHNTDAAGFRTALAQAGLSPAGRTVLVLGAGGVARVLAAVAAEEGAARVVILHRDPEKAKTLAREMSLVTGHDGFSAAEAGAAFAGTEAEARRLGADPREALLLNGTPVGMWPDTGGLPVGDGLLPSLAGVYDTIYNPLATRLVLRARSLGIPAAGGLSMLAAQAVEARCLWDPDQAVALRAALRTAFRNPDHGLFPTLRSALFRQSPVRYWLTGFMGSGKSTVGRRLAQEAGLPFLDLDAEIVRRAGRSIPELFEQLGEPGFRALERDALAACAESRESGIVAAGGGALLTDEAVAMVRRNQGLVVFLDVPYPVLQQRVGSGKGRPVFQAAVRSGPSDAGEDPAETLLRTRLPRYRAAADAIVPAADSPADVTRRLAGVLWEARRPAEQEKEPRRTAP